jgi:hypothetical protein
MISGLVNPWWVAGALLVMLGLAHVARMRTMGLVVLALTAVAGSAAFALRFSDWQALAVGGLTVPESMAVIGHAFLLAALVPLGPRLARALIAAARGR